MNITVSRQQPEEYNCDLLVYCIRQPKKVNNVTDRVHSYLKTCLQRAFVSKDFTGKEGQAFLCYPQLAKHQKSAKRLMAIGLGKDEMDNELFRKCGGTIARISQKTQAKKIMVVIPEFLDFPVSEMSECLAEGLVLGNYQFHKYKTTLNDDESPNQLKQAVFAAQNHKNVRVAAQKGVCAALAACKARDMAHEPGNKWTARQFADYSLQLSKKYGFKRTVFGKKDFVRMNMGGIIGVNKGSDEPPKMVILEHRTGKKKIPTILLVGKGLTFDSGGISIKPSHGMQDMKYDMCGGAAVLACMQAIGEEKLQHVDVVAVVPATDNMPGPRALKPGDIVTHYNGKNVEIISTDAEGRLILADALSYGVKRYKPEAVIDIATLTGAVIMGLGHHQAGLMSNDDKLAEKITQAGQKSGEPVWRLPLSKDYTKQLKSQVADLKNIGSPGAGSITAGAFLQEFIGKSKWAHIDIAGTAWDFTEKSYIPKGPSGFGVRLLLELVRSWGR